MQPSEKYPVLIRVLHWFMALLIVCMLGLGLYMTGVPRTETLHGTLYMLHKSLGVTVLVLAVIRVVSRMVLGGPPLPGVIGGTERVIANLGHITLYCFMFAMPMTGIILTNSFGFTVLWFGAKLPHIVGVNPDRAHLAALAHAYLAYALMGLIALHALGALKHLLKERLNLFKRIW